MTDKIAETFSEEESDRRTREAIRASFALPPKTHKEMAGKSGRPSRKAKSEPGKDRR